MIKTKLIIEHFITLMYRLINQAVISRISAIKEINLTIYSQFKEDKQCVYIKLYRKPHIDERLYQFILDRSFMKIYNVLDLIRSSLLARSGKRSKCLPFKKLRII
jgi:hypothetical protein